MSGQEELEKIKSLIKEDKTYAFVLDYALFGYTDAAREGSYEAHASLFPNFEKCLEKLVDEGIIVKRSGSRYTGPTSYFEVNISRDVVINALKEFYEEVRSNLEFLRESLEKYSITNFFYIYENKGEVSFSVDGYLGEVERPHVEQTCKELVLKGLMFAWTWVTKKHVYKCYRFRQRPFNCLEEFEKLMEHKLSRFVKVKIDDYIRKEYGAKLDYILGLIQTRDWNETQKYLKERGWSEKLIWEVRNALERERIIPHDFSSSLFQFLEEELANRIETINEIVQVKKPRELDKMKIDIRREGLLGKVKITFSDVSSVIRDIISELNRRNIEILYVDKKEDAIEIKLCCNRKLYVIKAQDSDIYSLPTDQFDKMIIIGKKILDYAFNQFMEQKRWTDTLLIDYKTRHIIGDLERDALFSLVNEKFRANRIYLTEPMNRIISYFTALTERLKESLTLNEGFVFTEPYNPWSLQQEFLSIFKDAKNTLKICVPYPDASTFSFLATVPPHVQIKMIILSDKDELKKKKKLSIEVLEKTISRKKIEIRRNPEIHVRF